MAKTEKGLKVVSCFIADSEGNEIPVVALAPIEPGEALRLDEPWQREWHHRPPYVPSEEGE